MFFHGFKSPKTTDCSLGPLDAWIFIEGAIFLVAIGLFFGLFEGVTLNRNLVLPIYNIDRIQSEVLGLGETCEESWGISTWKIESLYILR